MLFCVQNFTLFFPFEYWSCTWQALGTTPELCLDCSWQCSGCVLRIKQGLANAKQVPSPALSSSVAILFPFSSATCIKMNHVLNSLCSEVTASEHQAICTESLEKAIKIVGAASTQIP